MSGADCPICLESLIVSEEIFPLPCRKCEYNFCTKCVETFVRSSKDDYQEASDGSRQVKVKVICPQCRGRYPMDISKVLLLRRAHSLGSAIVDDETGNRHDDSELTATQLSTKRDFFSHSKKRQVDKAHQLYLQVMEGKIEADVMTSAETVCQRLFVGIPESESKEGDEDDDDYRDVNSSTPKKPPPPENDVDDTLFQGLEDCLGKDEKVFLTQLLTSGDAQKLAQAAMILNGILKLSTSAQSLLNKLSFEQHSTSKADVIDKMKKSFPLPNHMPGYFVIPVYSHKQDYLNVKDGDWDGSITPPVRSKKVFDSIYGHHYHLPLEARPVVLVKGVRGPVGRVGLRKSDVVTHVNDMDWTGTARELQEYIYQLYELEQQDEITMTVNANPETATFLKVRHGMMENSRVELI
jgi:hypothetical protein